MDNTPRELALEVFKALGASQSVHFLHIIIESAFEVTELVDALTPVELELVQSLKESNNLDAFQYFSACALGNEGNYTGLRAWIAGKAGLRDDSKESGFDFLKRALVQFEKQSLARISAGPKHLS